VVGWLFLVFQMLFSVGVSKGLITTLGCLTNDGVIGIYFGSSVFNSSLCIFLLYLECVSVNIEWKLLLSGPAYLMVFVLWILSFAAALSASIVVHLAYGWFGDFLPYLKFSLDLHCKVLLNTNSPCALNPSFAQLLWYGVCKLLLDLLSALLFLSYLQLRRIFIVNSKSSSLRPSGSCALSSDFSFLFLFDGFFFSYFTGNKHLLEAYLEHPPVDWSSLSLIEIRAK